MSTQGDQRLSLEQLHAWESLGYGMFIHFGMSTFDGAELSLGDQPSTLYAPDQLDVDQWIRVARDAGMRYAVLTAKHVSGHCLWPSKHTDYHVGTSSNHTDVVEAFVHACTRYHIVPGFYYCAWDNHHRFGSVTPSDTAGGHPYTTSKYRAFQLAQIEELLTSYGVIGEVWIDIPEVLPPDYREELYAQIACWQPEAVIVMNNCVQGGDGTNLRFAQTWPTDVVTIERHLPPSHTHHVGWRDYAGKRYYIPGEVCEPIGREWFSVADDTLRGAAELLGMYLVTRSRGANFLLDVGPDRHGLIPESVVAALMQLRAHIDRLGTAASAT